MEDSSGSTASAVVQLLRGIVGTRMCELTVLGPA